jgi:hypothetical protein
MFSPAEEQHILHSLVEWPSVVLSTTHILDECVATATGIHSEEEEE